MKYLVFVLMLVAGSAYGQTTYYIRADSTKLEKVGANNEFILKNGTRTRTGAYLKNTGNGITNFSYAIDSAWIFHDSLLVVRRGDGNDTLLIRGTGGSGTTPGIDDVLAVGNTSLHSAFLGDTLSVTDVGYGSSVRGYLESWFGTLRWSAPAAFPGRSFALSPSGAVNRVYQMPNANGTIALTSDIPATIYSGDGTLAGNRVVTQAGYNLAFGSVLSTALYTTFNYFDTATIANSSAIKGRGIQLNRNIVQGQSAVNISDKEGALFAHIFRLQDTLTILPQGSDLAYAASSQIFFKKRADYSGRTIVRSGNGGINYDATCAHLNSVLFPDDGSQGNIYFKGYLAASTAYLYGYNTTDTIENYIGFYSTGSNLMKVRNSYNFFGTGTAANADTSWGIYQIAEDYNFLSSKLKVGGGGTAAVADSTLQVIGGLHTDRGVRFTGLASSANATDSMMVVNASNGNVGYRAIPTGGGGGSGTVNSGVANHITYYPGTGTTVDDISGVTYDGTAFTSTGATSSNRTFFIENTDATGRAAIQMGTDVSALNGFFFANGSTKTDYAGAGSVNFMNITANPLGFITNNTLRMTVSGTGNLMLGGFTDPASAVYAFGITNGVAPSASITNGVVLYSEDVAASAELKVRDEAGNTTVLSPHAFVLTHKSDPMAWAYSSKNEKVGKEINVDMFLAMRTIEKQSAEIEQLKKDIAELKGLIYQMKEPVKLIYEKDIKKE